MKLGMDLNGPNGLVLEYAVLRCRPAETMALMEGLQEWDVWAWCPVFPVHVRLAHRRKPATVPRPLLPGLVFVPRQEMGKALELRRRRRVRVFQPFRFLGRAVYVSDGELQPLRDFSKAPQRTKRPRSATDLVIGDIVEMPESPFSRLRFTVIATEGAYTLVETKQWKTRVATCLLKKISLPPAE